MVLIPFLGISTINDRIVKNEDVFLKGQLGYGWVPNLRWLASNGSSNL